MIDGFRPDASLSVLDISEYYGETSGGVRTYLTEKARYVEARPALRQTVVVPGAHDTVSQTDGVRSYRLRSPPIPTQKPYRLLKDARGIARIIARERPDLIEVGSAHMAPWLVRKPARAGGIPIVWYYHGNIPRIIAPRLEADRLHRRWASAAAARYVRSIGRFMARTIVASDFARADLEAFGVERVSRIPLGVDTETFHPGRRIHAAETRRRHGLSDAPLALYTGRFTGEKELDLAVGAWRLLRHRDAVLLLIGAGPLGSRLAAHGRHHRVRVLPFENDRDALADLYAAADIYLAPGPAETFGLSAHEAMASGTPVLSVDRGAVAEQVLRSGAGAVYPHGDAVLLAAAADSLLDADLPMLGVRARSFIELHHRWDTAFDRLFDLYREVLAS